MEKTSNTFAAMPGEIVGNENFLTNIIFINNGTFHVNDCADWQNCRIWGSQPTNEIILCPRF